MPTPSHPPTIIAGHHLSAAIALSPGADPPLMARRCADLHTRRYATLIYAFIFFELLMSRLFAMPTCHHDYDAQRVFRHIIISRIVARLSPSRLPSLSTPAIRQRYADALLPIFFPVIFAAMLPPLRFHIAERITPRRC